MYTVSQKSSHLLTLCNFVKSYLTDFQSFCTAGKRMKFLLQNLYDITHLTLCCYTTLGNEKFEFSADVGENANKLHFNGL